MSKHKPTMIAAKHRCLITKTSSFRVGCERLLVVADLRTGNKGTLGRLTSIVALLVVPIDFLFRTARMFTGFQLRILAVSDSKQFVDHKLVVAALDPHLLQRSCHDVCPNGIKHAVADANRSSELFIQAFEAGRHVNTIAHHRIAESLGRSDVAHEHVGAIQSDPHPKAWPALRAPRSIDRFHTSCCPQRTRTRAQYMI